MFKNPLLNLAAAIYQWIINFNTRWLAPVFLLFIRLIFGWQLFVTGQGHFNHLDKVIEFFKSLGIPYPELNAHISSTTEIVGGLLLMAGLAGRIVAAPLIMNFIVAYWTASHDAVIGFFNNSDPFTKDDAFPFLVVALIVFLFGPGPLSVDGLITLILKKRTTGKPAAT